MKVGALRLLLISTLLFSAALFWVRDGVVQETGTRLRNELEVLASQHSFTISGVNKLEDEVANLGSEGSLDERLKSITQQIMSRTRLEEVVTQLDLYAEERKSVPREDLDARLREDSDVEVTPPRRVGGRLADPDSFRLLFTYGDPQTSMRVTEQLASWFIAGTVSPPLLSVVLAAAVATGVIALLGFWQRDNLRLLRAAATGRG